MPKTHYHFFKASLVLVLAAVLVGITQLATAQQLSKKARELPISPDDRGDRSAVTSYFLGGMKVAPKPKPQSSEVGVLGGPLTSPLLQVLPVIDGVMSPGEWSDALAQPIGYPTSGWPSYTPNSDVMMYIKNNCENLYFLFIDKRVTQADWDTYGEWTLITSFQFDIGSGNTRDYTWCTNPGVLREGELAWPDVWSPSLDALHGFVGSPSGVIQCYPYACSFWYPQANDPHYPALEWKIKFSPATGAVMEVRVPYDQAAFAAQVSYLNPFTIGFGLYLTRQLGGGFVSIDGSWNGYSSNYPWAGCMWPSDYNTLKLSAPSNPPYMTSFTNFDFQAGIDGYYVYNANSTATFQFDMASNPAQTVNVNWELVGPLPTSTVASSGTNAVTATAVEQTFNFNVPLTGLARGFYDLFVSIEYSGECGPTVQKNHFRIMVKDAGEGYCIVYPGDLNNDGACNFNDHAFLNDYIFNANLNTDWLLGPKRFLTGEIVVETPMDIFRWVPQPSLLWTYPISCYVDADGNGMTHNFDLFGVNINLGRMHGTPKEGSVITAQSFEMIQNFPNPFNPSTTISYFLPEESQVSLKVTDMLGREVAVLVNGRIPAGYHNVEWRPEQEQSGVFFYTITATGLGSGKTFAKTMKMSFAK